MNYVLIVLTKSGKAVSIESITYDRLNCTATVKTDVFTSTVRAINESEVIEAITRNH